MPSFLTNIYVSLVGFHWPVILYWSRIVFTVLDAVLVVAFVVVFAKARKFRPVLMPRLDVSGEANRAAENYFDIERYKEAWKKIKEKAFEAPPHSLTWGVVSADNLADNALKEMKLPGEHMADRLENLEFGDRKTLENLWRAHKIRNDLVHTQDFEISGDEAKELLDVYETFLKKLGALE